MDFADRAARNEEIFRDVNHRIDAGAEQHGVTAPLPFHCECGMGSCLETIEIPPLEYERVARERYRFVVLNGHENTEIERVLALWTRGDGFHLFDVLGEELSDLRTSEVVFADLHPAPMMPLPLEALPQPERR